MQRSITTSRPPVRAISAASQLTMPSWSQRTRAPSATASCAWAGQSSARRNTSTISNPPVAATAAARFGKAARPWTVAKRGVTGTASYPARRSAAKTSPDGRPGRSDAPITAIRRAVRSSSRISASPRSDTRPRPSWRSRIAARRVRSSAVTRALTGRPRARIAAPPRLSPGSRRRFALVRLAVGRRGDAPPDDAGQDDDRHDVGQGSKDLLGDRGQDPAQLARRRSRPDGDPERAGCREQERRQERPDGAPATEDERRGGDEPAPTGHASLEGIAEVEREPCAGQAREHPAEDDVAIAQPDHVDAHSLGGLGVLPDGPRPEPPPRPEEEDLQADDQDDHRQGDGALRQEHLEEPADEGQTGQRVGWHEGLELARRRQGVRAEQDVEVAGDPGCHDVDDRAADDLVDPEADGEPGVQGRHEHPAEHRGQEADQESGRDPEERAGSGRHRLGHQSGDEPADEGAGQHHPFDPDVDDAGPLAHDPAQGPEGERGRQGEDDRAVQGDHGDQVVEQLEDQPEDRHVEDAVHGCDAFVPPYVPVTVESSSTPAAAARIRKTRRTTMSAARKKRITPWSRSIICTGTPAWICIRLAPARMAPRSRPANTMPSGWTLPRRATVIASKPTLVESVSYT